MAPELDRYLGREQSYIKHLFLSQYLQVAGFKIFQGRSHVFNFVDAFAGPWNVSDSANYSDTSFARALQTLEEVRAYLSKSKAPSLKVRFCFSEKRSEAVEELRHYAKRYTRFDIRVFHGAFEDNLDGIAAECPDGFTFTFIDPTGWNVRSEPVLQFLRRQNGEFLFNFMAEHVNRHAEYPKVADSFVRFLGNPNWENEFDALPSSWSNEMRIMHLLKAKIRASGAASYLPDFPILKPREARVKMRLLFGTHSPAGLEVFRDVQAKVERQQIEMRNQLRDESDNQIGLFSDNWFAAIEQNDVGVGSPRYQLESETRVTELLAEQRFLYFREIANDVLESIPIRMAQIRKLLVSMKKRGVVAYELPSNRRVPQPETRVSLVVSRSGESD